MPEITIYTSQSCAPCKILKAKLQLLGWKFIEKDVSDPVNKQFLFDNNLRSVPQVFVDGKHTGNSVPHIEGA